MKWALFLSLFVLAPISYGAEFRFQDTDCKLLSPDGIQVKVTKGDKSESTCVLVSNEAFCHYRDLSTGESQGQPTKYTAIDLGGVQLWTSLPSGNIKIFVNENGRLYYYGMTYMGPTGLLNKQCVGRIVSQIK